MARRSSNIAEADATRTAAQQPSLDEGGFASEFRELARQRRFVREAGHGTAPAPTSSPAMASSPAMTTSSAAMTSSAGTTSRTAAPSARWEPAARAPLAGERLTDTAADMLGELARMSDRLVSVSEELAVARTQAEYSATALADANTRLMAARALVQDAQGVARHESERCIALESRAATLQQALEVAVHAGVVTRWKWRRRMAASGRAPRA